MQFYLNLEKNFKIRLKVSIIRILIKEELIIDIIKINPKYLYRKMKLYEKKTILKIFII